MAKVQWRNPNESAVHQLNAKVQKVSFSDLHQINDSGFVLFPFYSDIGYFFVESEQHSQNDNFPAQPQVSEDTTKAQYINNVEAALGTFSSSDLSKVVLARQWSSPAIQVNEDQLFKLLCKKYPSAFVYTVTWADGTLFGASPELLIEHRESVLKSMALAGTRPNKSESLFTQKEIDEQKFVQRFIEQIADRLDLELVEKSNRYEKEAGHLKHLCNDYKWNSPSTEQVVRFLRDLHPTPAVAGTPRDQAIDFIHQHERFNRNFYAGFLGEWSPNQQRLYVNLRCGLHYNERQYLYAGAGISIDSNPADEWMETSEKLKTLELVLGQLEN